jgi:hypothetical protein
MSVVDTGQGSQAGGWAPAACRIARTTSLSGIVVSISQSAIARNSGAAGSNPARGAVQSYIFATTFTSRKSAGSQSFAASRTNRVAGSSET